MDTSENDERQDSKEKPPVDDLIAEVNRILEEEYPNIGVEEITPPRSMHRDSNAGTD